MKKLLILGLIFTFVGISASAQQNRNGLMRRYRMEQGFNRRPIARSERLRMMRHRLHYRMQQRRLHRYAFIRPRGQRRLVVRNHFNRGRMFLYRRPFYKGRRVI
ncbi:MAG TPA: hypothetical protein VET23_01140 [Chitinophagaceae bacterium]|nr:hypothetical protein [Chitinophagaceae bacterium]